MISFEKTQDPSARFIDQGNRLSDEEIRKTVEHYKEVIAERTRGPQLEGVESASLEEALRSDPNIILADIHDTEGEIVRWPLLIPVEHHIDYSQRFFEEHYPDRPSYFLSLPPYGNIEELLTHVDDFAEFATRLKQERAIIAYDFVEGLEGNWDDENERLIPEFLNSMLADVAELEDITPQSKLDGIEYGLPKVVHYEGYVGASIPPENPVESISEAFKQMIEKGELARQAENGIAYPNSEVLRENDNELLKQIWTIYDDPFNELTEDHPSLQKQPQEELERMLLNDESINIVYMEEGKDAGLLYLVHQIESCVWLNKKFYDERYAQKGWLAYYPGIVVAKERARQGIGYAQKMIGCLGDAVKATNQRMIVTCQCTNVSMTYVTKIVQGVIDAQPGIEMIADEGAEAFTKVAEYNYRVAQVI